MLIPGYRAEKVMADNDQGFIRIFEIVEDGPDKVLFIIHTDGTMDLSQEVINAALFEDGVGPD